MVIETALKDMTASMYCPAMGMGSETFGVISYMAIRNTEKESMMLIDKDSLSPHCTGTKNVKLDRAASIIIGPMMRYT